MRIVVIVLLLAIIGSLGSALFFLFSDKPGSQRTVRALTLRVGLSLLLFALLIAGYALGLIGRPA